MTKDEYKEGCKILKRYKRNCVYITDKRMDIISNGNHSIDGMPRPKYNISDKTANAVIKLDEDENLKQAIKEYQAVRYALELVSEDSKYIFENYFIKSKSRWQIMYELNISDRTFLRRKNELCYNVYKEFNKIKK